MTVALPFSNIIYSASNVAIQDNAYSIDLGDGYQQAGNIGLNTQYELWSITWAALNDADFATLKSVLDTAGCVQTLTMPSPLDGVTKLYRVVQNSRKYQSVGAKWRVDLSLRQVFTP